MKNKWFLRMSALVLGMLLAASGCGRSAETQDISPDQAQEDSPHTDNGSNIATESGTDLSDTAGTGEPIQLQAASIIQLDPEAFQKYDRVVTINNGVAIVCKDNRYGATDLDGNEIREVKYTSCGYPDQYGNFILSAPSGMVNIAHVYDRNGEEKYFGNGGVAVSQGMIIYTTDTQTNPNKEWVSSNIYYRTTENEEILQRFSCCTYGAARPLGYLDGYSIAYESSDETPGKYHVIDENGEIVKTFEEPEDADAPFKQPLNPPCEGYFLTRCENREDPALHLIDVSDGRDVGQINLSYIVSDGAGGLKYDTRRRSDKCLLINWVIDSTEVGNYGTRIVVMLDGKFYLIDLSKCYFRGTDEGEYGMEPSAVLGVFDVIGLSRSDWWLVLQDGKYGYIDHDGNVKALYEDASLFVKGYAIVKTDGEMWLIDEDLQPVRSLGACINVIGIGDSFWLTREDGSQTIYYIE